MLTPAEKLEALSRLPADELERCLGAAVRSGDCPLCEGYFHRAESSEADDYLCDRCGFECTRGPNYWAI